MTKRDLILIHTVEPRTDSCVHIWLLCNSDSRSDMTKTIYIYRVEWGLGAKAIDWTILGIWEKQTYCSDRRYFDREKFLVWGKLLRVQLVIAFDVRSAEGCLTDTHLRLRKQHHALPANQMSAGSDFVAELPTATVDTAGRRWIGHCSHLAEARDLLQCLLDGLVNSGGRCCWSGGCGRGRCATGCDCCAGNAVMAVSGSLGGRRRMSSKSGSGRGSRGSGPALSLLLFVGIAQRRVSPSRWANLSRQTCATGKLRSVAAAKTGGPQWSRHCFKVLWMLHEKLFNACF